MFGGGRVGVAVALVVFDGLGQMLRCGLAECRRFVQKHEWAKRTLGKLEQRALPRFAWRPEKGWVFPGGLLATLGAFWWRNGPFGEWKQRCAYYRIDRSLRARIEFP